MAEIDDVVINIAVELGSSNIPVHQLLRMGRGAVIELDANEDSLVTVLANNVPIAIGKVDVEGEIIRVILTEILLGKQMD